MKTLKAVLAVASLVVATGAMSAQIPRQMVQINLSGAEYAAAKIPGRANFDYVLPSAAALDTWKAKGVMIARVPIVWKRLQPTLNQPLAEAYASEIDAALKLAAERGMSLLIDVHDYGTYSGKIIGTADVPFSAYGNLMWRMAQRWAGNPGLHGYDIMNEPHDAADVNWVTAAQTAVTQIRRFDKVKPIYVEGRSWASAARWQEQSNGLLAIRDPNDNIIFSAHLYLDSDASGTYPVPPAANFDLDIGVKRAAPFVEWLIRNNKRGHIGEFGVPGNDPRWTEAMDRLMAYLQTNCVPLAYWAAGPWWGTYALAIEPAAGAVKPQWTVLSKYVQTKNCP